MLDLASDYCVMAWLSSVDGWEVPHRQQPWPYQPLKMVGWCQCLLMLYIFLSKVSIIQQDKKTFELMIGISNDATEDAAPPGVVAAAHTEQLNLPPANHAAAAPCANSSVTL